ncbi:GGDEF domain-containing protein [Ureibacillus acetophenoni]|uniref:Diguanylate cyclase (GGDEF)-like protein n=1 Tax=Ureibacillus acetophenoni TaxID=614649 RepID=A0A285UM57_9BACL|nr:GGDEF domain-containing protein [Ureibacillus acetophenoni]SOC42767.1 diguanylate cyclase (GGDEF)-like protein [Ureibacillus acetophenoni]
MIEKNKHQLGYFGKTIVVICIAIFGFTSLLYSIFELIQDEINPKNLTDSFIIVVLIIMTFSMAVTLPSGSVWRPFIGFVIFSAFVFPYHYSVLITFTGVLIFNFSKWTNIHNAFITFGHLTLGILAVTLVSNTLSEVLGYELPQAFCWLGLGIVAHFFINRFVAAIIVSYRKKNSLLNQIKLIKYDLNWGYTSQNLLSICMVLLYEAYGIWGIFVTVLLLYSIYFSVLYFKKVNDLEVIALTDALTGAENRSSWEEFKRRFPEEGASGTFVLVDLDNFKQINDQLGHNVGDLFLRETVDCLKHISSKKHRVFRIGGDEFILYISHREEEQVAIHALINKKIKQKNIDWMNKGFTIALSIGMTFVPTKDENLNEMFKLIDKRMYMNKEMNKIETNET